MPSLKTYDLFISHAWKYGDSYDRLVSLLRAAPNFRFRNYSAPSEKPLLTSGGTAVLTKSQIKDAIKRKIRPVNCVLVLSGMYLLHREWMQYELEVAAELCKPIIAVKPWSNKEVPLAVQIYADEIVSWNTSSIVQAIRKHSL